MSFWLDVAFIAAGLVALGIAVFGKNFHNSDVLTASADYGPAPQWSGKFVFAIVGVGLLALGIYELIK